MAAFLAYILIDWIIIKPVSELQRVAQTIGKGDMNSRVTIKTKDEIEQLGVVFNKMISDVHQITVSKDYFDNIIQTMTDLLIVVTPNLIIETINRAALVLLGYKKEELIAKPLGVIFTGLGQNGSLEFKQLRQLTLSGELRDHKIVYKTRDGRELFLLLSSAVLKNPQGEITHIVFTCKDISDLEHALQVLHDSEEKYRTMIQESNDFIWILDRQGNFVYFNKVTEQVSGYSLEDWSGKSFEPLIFPEDLPRVKNIFVEAMGGKSLHYDIRINDKFGNIFDLSVNTAPMYASGKITGAINFGRDITERKQMENNLKDSKKMLESITQGITDEVLLLSKDFKIIWANNTILKQAKLELKDVIGKYCYEVTHNTKEPCNNASELCPIDNILKTGNSTTLEHIHFQADGSKQFVEVSVSPVKDKSGEIIQFVHLSRDITVRKEAEYNLQETCQRLQETQEQLIQSSKMAAMGQLAAGISHELNQPLTGIKGFAQALLMDFDEKNPFRKDINKIVEQANRIDKIIKNVRTFARKSESDIEAVDLNKTVEDAFSLINEQLKLHNILVNKSLDKNLPKIRSDSNQLLQVFVNFITNARDAIDCLQRPEGGTITVKTLLCQDNAYVQLIFQDDGCGIEEENLSHIFNPFFTTKSPDKGMGLGLAIVYRIIEDHDGKINVESQKGKGSIFTITLPIDGKNNEQA